ncbi:alpha/beta hydrolase [Antarctobacter sp.]|uniref:alpha/beta fold hydrolase n=1 Tax=Antarctobacter sp. TaxID=1872577 RepID=UPI002B26DB75|nr:alpha/beta hydrolase [Antarctobacter sp.]
MKSNTSDPKPDHSITTKRLTRYGVDTVYRVCGDGPAVVLIPSLGRGTEDFDALLPHLMGAGLRLILPEPRGIEGSAPLQETDTLHEMAADVAAIIEAESAAPAVLVGHAAGNWVARVLAHDRPDLTRAVALVAAIVTNTVPDHVKASISASFDMTLQDQERLKHLQNVYFAPGADASVWLDGWWPEVSAAQRRAAQQTPDKGWIRVADHHPTLYLGAAQDVISPPPELGALRDTIGPKAECEVITDAGHALLPEQPEPVAKALAVWVKRLSQKGTELGSV